MSDLTSPVAEWPDEQVAFLARSGSANPVFNVRRALAAEVLRLREMWAIYADKPGNAGTDNSDICRESPPQSERLW